MKDPQIPSRGELKDFADLFGRAERDKAGGVTIHPGGVLQTPPTPAGAQADGPKAVRVRISSDGGPNTFVYDDATGAIVGRVQKISWEASVDSPIPRARLELACVPVEIVAEAEIVKAPAPLGEHTFQVGTEAPAEYLPNAETVAGMLHDLERKRDPRMTPWADLLDEDRAVKTAVVMEVFSRLTPFRSGVLLPGQTGRGSGLTETRAVWSSPPSAWRVVPETRHQAHPVSRRVAMELEADGRSLGLKEGGPDFAEVARSVVAVTLARLVAHGVVDPFREDGAFRKIDPAKDVSLERLGPTQAAVSFVWHDWDGTRMHDTVVVEAVR